jgi:tetratricopeptide (TPR) repeat protein
MKLSLATYCLVLLSTCSFLGGEEMNQPPIDLYAYVNEAEAYTRVGDYDSALKVYFEGLAINPDFIDVQFGKKIGRWTEQEIMTIGTFQLPPDKKLKNSYDVAGKTLLGYYIKGHGDTLQFSRFLTTLVEDLVPASVLFVPQKGLVDLFQNSLALLGDRIQIIDPASDLSAIIYDYHTHLLSLPHLLGTSADTIPHRTRYLLADTIEDPLGLLNSPEKKIGIIWQGDPGHIHDKDRSTMLRAFSILRDIPDSCFYSLQVGYGKEQLADADNGWSGELIDLGQYCTSFASVASWMDAMDLIITIDTAAAHLASALGKPTLILIPKNPDLRWAGDGTKGFWSNTSYLVRQSHAGDWIEVMERIKIALTTP